MKQRLIMYVVYGVLNLLMLKFFGFERTLLMNMAYIAVDIQLINNLKK